MSIHGRLMRSLLLAIIPLVIVIGASLYVLVRGALVSSLDDGLLARARAIAGIVKLEPEGVELDVAEGALARFESEEDGEFFEVWQHAGDGPARSVPRSGSLGGRHLSAPGPNAEEVVWDDTVEGFGRVRVVGVRIELQPETVDEAELAAGGPAPASAPAHVTLVVARGRAELDRTLALLGGALAIAGIALIGGCVLIVRAALAWGLAPIGRLSDEVSAIGPGDLTRRVGGDDAPVELRPMAERVNQLLDRVGAAIERERRFAGHAAHELRTPIAEIRAASETALARERSGDEYRRVLSTVLETSQRMSSAADGVLRLARVQSGRESATLRPIDLRSAIEPAWSRLLRTAGARGIRHGLNIPAGQRVMADGAMLDIILTNVLTNAAEHTPDGGTIAAECEHGAEGTLILRLMNDAGRFGEGSAASPGTSDALHAGLGLQVARSMAEACGGRLEAARSGGRFRVELTFIAAAG